MCIYVYYHLSKYDFYNDEVCFLQFQGHQILYFLSIFIYGFNFFTFFIIYIFLYLYL